MFTQAYHDGIRAALAKFGALDPKSLFNEPPPLPHTGAASASHPLDPSSFGGKAVAPHANIEHMISSTMANHPAPASMGNVPLRAKAFKKASLDALIKQAFAIDPHVMMALQSAGSGAAKGALTGGVTGAGIGALFPDEGRSRWDSAARGAVAGGLGGGMVGGLSDGLFGPNGRALPGGLLGPDRNVEPMMSVR